MTHFISMCQCSQQCIFDDMPKYEYKTLERILFWTFGMLEWSFTNHNSLFGLEWSLPYEFRNLIIAEGTRRPYMVRISLCYDEESCSKGITKNLPK